MRAKNLDHENADMCATGVGEQLMWHSLWHLAASSQNGPRKFNQGVLHKAPTVLWALRIALNGFKWYGVDSSEGPKPKRIKESPQTT